MNFARDVTPTLTIASQPDEADLEALKPAGYAGVVNLRGEGEPEQPISAVDEGEKVRALGLDYLHVPVVGNALPASEVERFCDFLDAHAGDRVLIHCRKGGRAAALVLLHQALAHRWSAREAVERGKALGLDVDGPLRVLVETFLDDHRDRP